MKISREKSVSSVSEWFRGSHRSPYVFYKQVWSKITGLVLDTIEKELRGDSAALLPAMTTPEFVISGRLDWGKRRKIQRKWIPLGLKKCESCSWMNAWVQFFFHIPKLLDLFAFMSRRFEFFQAFIDQYILDQQKNRMVSSANSTVLASFFSQMGFVLSDDVDFYEVFRLFFLLTQVPSSFRDSIAFYPEEKKGKDRAQYFSFTEEILKKMRTRPPEILLARQLRKTLSGFALKRYSTQDEGRYFYDLDAFVECRSDEHSICFITYVKLEGVWYQCDDEKIREISPTTLCVPLHRAVLFHYKRTMAW